MRYDDHTDEALVPLVQQGDEQAYATLYHRHVVALVGFVESKLYSLEDARDLVHELFVELWMRREWLKVEYSFRTYLFAAARHRIVDHIRRNLVREEYAEHLRRLSPAFRSLEEELNARELEANVTNQLTQLPETTRRIYLLSREEGKSIKEIAETLHLSEQTVKNNISKALKHLRNTLHAFFFFFF